MMYKKRALVTAFLALFLLTGCKQNEDVSNFFLMVVFMITMSFTGIPALVFSAISLKSSKAAIYILATVFTLFYLLVSIAMLPIFKEAGRYATDSTASLFMIVLYGGVIVSIVLTIIGYVNRAKGNVNVTIPTGTKTEEEELEYLDKLIEEDEDAEKE